MRLGQRLFSYNRFNLFSFYDRDHGARDGSTLRPWVEKHLADAGLEPAAAHIRLLCMPRVLGYVFDPISIYYCSDREGNLAAVLYEVKNTFGDQHGYLFPVERGQTAPQDHVADKIFHVSPLIAMNARYRIRTASPDDRLAVLIREFGRRGRIPGRDTDRRTARYDGCGITRLVFLYSFPDAEDHDRHSLRGHPTDAAGREIHHPARTAGERGVSAAAATGCRIMSGAINLEGRLRAGSLEIDLPDGRTVRLTGKQDGPSARLTLHRWRALRRFFGGGTVGFGESFMDGDWDSFGLAESNRAGRAQLAAKADGVQVSFAVAHGRSRQAPASSKYPRRVETEHRGPLRPWQRLLRTLVGSRYDLFIGCVRARRQRS